MRILLIGNRKLFYECLKSTLQAKGIVSEILFKTKSLDGIEEKKFVEEFDVILLDGNANNIKEDLNILELAKELIEKKYNIKIILLTNFKKNIHKIKAKKIGLHGVVYEENSLSSLFDILEKVDKNKMIFDNGENNSTIQLTNKEEKILMYYASGMCRKEVALKCNISISTLAYNLNSIYNKLNVENYQQMVNKALKIGYINLNNLY